MWKIFLLIGHSLDFGGTVEDGRRRRSAWLPQGLGWWFGLGYPCGVVCSSAHIDGGLCWPGYHMDATSGVRSRLKEGGEAASYSFLANSRLGGRIQEVTPIATRGGCMIHNLLHRGLPVVDAQRKARFILDGTQDPRGECGRRKGPPSNNLILVLANEYGLDLCDRFCVQDELRDRADMTQMQVDMLDKISCTTGPGWWKVGLRRITRTHGNEQRC